MPGGSTVIDFSQFSSYFTFTTGPVQVGGLVGSDVTWESNYSNSVIGNGGYGLAGNGFWDAGRNGFVGTNGATGVVMTFRFNDGPIGAVGGFVNYAPVFYGDFIIQALGAGDVVLESFNVTANAPISTPAQTNAGAFRGIERTTDDIFGFRLTGAYDVLDNLTFAQVSGAPPAVPLPAAVWGGIALFGGLGLKKFRRPTSAVA